MRVHCNAGSHLTNLSGDLPGHGTVWYDPKAIANILSLWRVQDHYHITYDSAHQKLIITKPSGKEFAFQESEGRLHYLDTTCPQGKQQQQQQQGHVFTVNTIRDNKKNFTNNDYLQAVRAWKFAFQESEGRLHYLDTTCSQGKQQQQQQGHVFAVNTVRDNKKNFTNDDYLQAVRAQELQVMVRRPSDKDLIKILKTSSLPN